MNMAKTKKWDHSLQSKTYHWEEWQECPGDTWRREPPYPQTNRQKGSALQLHHQQLAPCHLLLMNFKGVPAPTRSRVRWKLSPGQGRYSLVWGWSFSVPQKMHRAQFVEFPSPVTLTSGDAITVAVKVGLSPITWVWFITKSCMCSNSVFVKCFQGFFICSFC